MIDRPLHSHIPEFLTYIGSRSMPNAHEKSLFLRAQKYIAKISNIPGIRMIAVCNSLAMYATHEKSDIDLFIITQPGMLWWVRVLVTLRFWWHGVWRHGKDISGNFCLSFFVTSDAIDMQKIAIKNDIYLAAWIYTLKPIVDRDTMYLQFLAANKWVPVEDTVQKSNQQYLIVTESNTPSWWKKFRDQGIRAVSRIFAWIFRPKTLRRYRALGSPEWVVITHTMLKFHDRDQRAYWRKRFFWS